MAMSIRCAEYEHIDMANLMDYIVDRRVVVDGCRIYVDFDLGKVMLERFLRLVQSGLSPSNDADAVDAGGCEGSAYLHTNPCSYVPR